MELEIYRGKSKMKIMQTLKRDLEAEIVLKPLIHVNKEESYEDSNTTQLSKCKTCSYLA
jgi:hypothetical protein